jgi:hypothetical protein
LCSWYQNYSPLSVKWDDSNLYDKLGDSILCAKWDDLILYVKCQLKRYPDHGLVAFHASALTLSLSFKKKKRVFCLFLSYILSDKYFKVKNKCWIPE